MKIKRVYFDNFRSKDSESYPLTNINLFIGANGSGKSTIKAAMQMALTGTNEWSNNASDNAQLIKYDKPFAQVGVDIQSIGTLTRTIQKGKNIVELNGGVIPQREVVEYLDQNLDTNQSVLSCVLDSDRFLLMDAKAQKDFLLKAVDLDLNQANLLSKIDLNNLDINVAQTITDLIKEVIPDEQKIKLENLDDYYKTFFEKRKIEKKNLDIEIKNRDKLENTIMNNPVNVSKLLSEIGKEKTLILKKEKILKELGAILPLESQQKNIKQKIEALDRQIDQNKLKNPLLSLSDIEEKTKELKDIISEMTEEIQDNKNLKAYKEGLLANNKKIYKSLLENKGSVCPLSEKLLCTANKNSLIKELEAVIPESEKEIAQLSELIKEKSNDFTNKKVGLEELQKEKGKTDKLITLNKEKSTLITELSSIVVPDMAKINEQKNEIEAELKKISEAKSTIAIIKKTEEDFNQSVSNCNKLLITVTSLEFLVEKFGPGKNGLKAIIVKETIDPLEDYVNETLKTLGGGIYSVRFDFENDFNIIVKKEQENNNEKVVNEIPYRFLSESEYERLGFIMADMINTITNSKVLSLDRLDKLDESNAEFLINFLKSVKDNYDTILLMGTKNPTTKKIEKWLTNISETIYILS